MNKCADNNCLFVNTTAALEPTTSDRWHAARPHSHLTDFPFPIASQEVPGRPSYRKESWVPYDSEPNRAVRLPQEDELPAQAKWNKHLKKVILWWFRE